MNTNICDFGWKKKNAYYHTRFTCVIMNKEQSKRTVTALPFVNTSNKTAKKNSNTV